MMRRDNDAYYTPVPMTQVLKRCVPIRGLVFEPCAGNLHIAKQFPLVVTNDIDERSPANHHLDATLPSTWNWEGHITRCDWVVTNPPFSDAFTILEHAWRVARVGVAFLVRLSFIEPTNRRGGWLKAHEDHLSHMIIFGSPRPNFRKGEINPNTGKRYGGDSVTTCWLVWQKEMPASAKVHFATRWNK